MIYTIHPGEFNFKPDQFALHFGTTSETYEVEYNESCIYSPIDWENDWNKLGGWSYGLLPFRKEGKWHPAHHNNSIRIGTRPAGGGIEHEIYTYQNGKRMESAGTFIVQLNTRAVLKLSHTNNNAVTLVWYDMSGFQQRAIALDCPIKPSFGYRLYPTFGGTYPSPQKIEFYMKRL